MKTYCCGFAFCDTRSNVLLIKKAKPDWQRGYYNGIGGTVEPKETALHAMTREFQEEAGLVTEPDQWKELVTLTDERVAVFFFYAHLPIMALEFCIKDKFNAPEPVSLHDVKKLPDLIIPNLRWLIPLACDDAPYYGTQLPVTMRFRSPIQEGS